MRDTEDAFKREVFGERSLCRSSETATDTNIGVKRLPTPLILLSKKRGKPIPGAGADPVPEETLH